MKSILALLALALVGCASSPPFQSVPLGAKFELLGAIVQAPNEPDWYLIGVNQVNLALGKRLPSRSESLIASSTFFMFEYNADDDTYLNQIMKERAAKNDATRFTVVSVTNELVDFKGARCFTYKTSSADHGAKGVTGNATQYLKTMGMVCRHPSNKAIAVQIEVSHRSPVQEFPTAYLPVANKFIQELQLVDNKVR
ncbi:hypothetical protein [Undibacterium flavidum]|uniref:Lipoprotein n=1 Tax=Undibacterium flavidum TaxID=2762297 RepID=A0ABR6YEW3_9BURK|nr:hypothetical protein [Undibacterium flavidum]MBC3875095.1 hypothetical protein [Undibacterium flavidum]